MLLEAKNLIVYYGKVKALDSVSFVVQQGEIVAVVGPNGAGKSTALKAVSGILDQYDGRIEQGEVLFEGKDIKGFRTDQLVKRGMTLVPENRRVFPSMTVLENLEMGAYTVDSKNTIKNEVGHVLDLFPQLKARLHNKAGTLSTGEQQMLTLGRALMLRPKLLLADEPSLGLSPNFVEVIFDKLIEINKSGVSILLVEQNARMALEICHRAYAFDLGSVAFEGERGTLLKSENVKKMYLGG